MELIQTTIRLTALHKDWLTSQEGGMTQAIRDLTTKAMESPAEKLKKLRIKSRKDRFIASLRLVFHLRPAMELSNVKDCDLEEWAVVEGANFKARVKSAQRDFLDMAEGWIIECVQGHRSISKQAMTGLIGLLNNHHPQWGRVKSELLSKIFNPIFDMLLKIVKESVDETTYKIIAEKFQVAKSLHFSAFSD